MSIPELPPSGFLRVLVIAASLSLLSMLIAVVRDFRAKRWATVWLSGIVFALAMATMAMARLLPALHPVFSMAVLCTLVFQATKSRGLQGALQIFAAVTWAIALVCARSLF